jgi:hypothetical protein
MARDIKGPEILLAQSATGKTDQTQIRRLLGL